ncbi:DUF6083 domain-containing protein (plasmid) [Streptomyces sp. NBC_01544]|uniref:DUF6083 domain-containing protein n=1 Tax=Streptomyces sp. NBC_01544 TaxID=2975871 RepID=UPI002F9134FF
MAPRGARDKLSLTRHDRFASYRSRQHVRTLKGMGDTENTAERPDRPDNALQAALEGATALPPPAPPDCPHCTLPQDRYPTLHEGHWVLLEPRIVVPAHTAPPRRRWIITPDGNAMNLWDAEPVPGAQCRIAHRMACPYLEPEDPYPWTTMLRQENERRAQRLFNLPGDWDLPDTG